MIIAKTIDPATPKSIPAKHRQHIQFFDDERDSGNGIIVTLVGLAYQDAGTNAACHVFGEDTLGELKSSLKYCSPCDCEVCKAEGEQL